MVFRARSSLAGCFNRETFAGAIPFNGEPLRPKLAKRPGGTGHWSLSPDVGGLALLRPAGGHRDARSSVCVQWGEGLAAGVYGGETLVVVPVKP